MKSTFLAIVVIALVGMGICDAQESQHQQPLLWPSLMSDIKIAQSLNFCGELVALDVQEVHERLEKELLLTIWNRPQVALWIKRSPRYLPINEKMLSENYMPDDLK